MYNWVHSVLLRRIASILVQVVFLLVFPFRVSGSDAFSHIKDGDSFVSSGDVSAAEAAFSAAIRLDQGNKIAYTKRATARSRMGQLGGAVADLTAALAIEPKSIATRLERAELYLRLCSFDSADSDYKAILDSKTDHDGALHGTERVMAGRAHLETAEMLMHQRDYKSVDGALSRLNRVASDCRPARLLAAQMYLHEGNYEKCTWETGRLLKTEPGNVQALLLRGDAFYHLEDFDLAKRHYGEVITNYDPDNSDALARFKKVKAMKKDMDAVRMMVRLRKWSEAEGKLTALLDAFEESHTTMRKEVLSGLGRAQFHLKRGIQVALKTLEAVLQQGYDEEAFVTKVEIFFQQEKFEEALRMVEEAIEEEGRNKRLLELRSQAQQLLKKSKMKDYHKLLGVPKDADESALKKAFRKLALKYHPDKVDGDKQEAEAYFAELSEAYEVLTDPEKRRLYDMGEDPFKDEPNHGQGGFRFRPGTTFHFNFG
eukprot:jgi/Ulvmu1/7277/UM035_0065.1